MEEQRSRCRWNWRRKGREGVKKTSTMANLRKSAGRPSRMNLIKQRRNPETRNEGRGRIALAPSRKLKVVAETSE